MIRRTIRKILRLFLSGLFRPLKFLVWRSNVIILQTYSPFLYCENTRYLFEHLSEHASCRVYWVTESPEVQEYLRAKGYRYLTNRNLAHKIWVTLKAGIVIDSGSGYYNFLNLVGRDVVKITTMHGCGPKATTAVYDSLDDSLVELKNMARFDFVNFPSKYAGTMVGLLNLKLPPRKILSLGYPRCDQYFDESAVLRARTERKWSKQLVKNFRDGDRVILYTPTWRPYLYRFPLFEMKGLDIPRFDAFLRENNLYFFYTFHTANLPDGSFPLTERIRRIEHERTPLFDINLFMMETDILLDDYATTSTEFALLRRPQVFFMPDYDYYLEHKGFIEDYKAIMPGPEVASYEELTAALRQCLDDPEACVARYEKERDLLINRYYDVGNRNSSENIRLFIDKIMAERRP